VVDYAARPARERVGSGLSKHVPHVRTRRYLQGASAHPYLRTRNMHRLVDTMGMVGVIFSFWQIHFIIVYFFGFFVNREKRSEASPCHFVTLAD
jgi:hypothetical protein